MSNAYLSILPPPHRGTRTLRSIAARAATFAAVLGLTALVAYGEGFIIDKSRASTSEYAAATVVASAISGELSAMCDGIAMQDGKGRTR